MTEPTLRLLVAPQSVALPVKLSRGLLVGRDSVEPREPAARDLARCVGKVVMIAICRTFWFWSWN